MVKKSKMNNIKVFARLKEHMGITIAFVVVFIILSFATDKFLTQQNLFNVIRQITVNIFLTCGLTLAILTGGIDLSVGSTMAVSACLLGGFITHNGMPAGIAILLSILCGMFVGIINGSVISYTNIPPFIVTLATMYIGRGFARIYTDCSTILIQNPIITFIGKGQLFGKIPVHIIFIILSCIACSLILNRTRFGRHIYAIGDNELAAVYSGIKVKKVKFIVYVIVSLFAASAGILSAARTSSALFSVGEGYEMDAISSVVLGGTSMSGGVGRLGGSIIGALLIGIISNGMNLLGIDSSWQYIVKGCALLIAVYIDYVKRKKA
jgi:ribose transport system permease protein